MCSWIHYMNEEFIHVALLGAISSGMDYLHQNVVRRVAACIHIVNIAMQFICANSAESNLCEQSDNYCEVDQYPKTNELLFLISKG